MNSDVKSAKRVLSILQFFAQTKTPATLTQISSALGFPKSSCLALLDTLEGEGYARLDAGRYYLTRRWLNEARIVAEHDQLTAQIRPELERLRDMLGETLILGQRSGRRVVYLDVAEPDRVVRFTAWAGQTKPLHASASGRALLGALDVPERKQLLESLALDRYTAKTPTTLAAVRKEIDRGLRRGWHVNLGEHQADTLSIACALRVYGTPYCLVVGAPMDRAQKRAEEIGRALAASCGYLAEHIEGAKAQALQE
ncbi:IclR family transcriptional regulator [Candidimonas nitroreducens]|uniref:IclR family transcriptional regulator n=1 Tax=Candidimonas nitroreducens TaxID=683354 RepID=A0A225MFF8_9BURK|nr:IclR family transcriptional regulator [Candidimonas nitroreducens]OWT60076.1 IclR family transcriptional regulator [Candidimonas nitroreducens]